MSRLEPQHQDQIEEILGRPLDAEEIAEVVRAEQLSDAHRRVARVLATRQPVLCGRYLRAVAPITISTAKRIIDVLADEEDR